MAIPDPRNELVSPVQNELHAFGGSTERCDSSGRESY